MKGLRSAPEATRPAVIACVFQPPETLPGLPAAVPYLTERIMAKGNNRTGNRETKKPKQEKPKAAPAATPLNIARPTAPKTGAGKKAK